MTPATEKAAPITALLPCPFCGSEAMECHVAEPTVQCTTCPAGVVGETEAEAVATWNGRADRASQEERIREDERDRLYAEAVQYLSEKSVRRFLSDCGAMLPADRARLRGGAS